MPHVRSLRRLVLCTAIVGAVGCGGGEDVTNGGLSGFTVSQGSQPTNPTNGSAETGASSSTIADTTAAETAGDTDPVLTSEPTTDPSDGTTSTPGTTTTVDPSTTTTVDPSTTTNVDPSTTTNVDPSTTSGDESTTDVMPPMKDPQPLMGMYEHCLVPDVCDLPANVCLQLQDANMKVTDGYCTKLCKVVGDCGAKPNAPATLDCYSITAMDKICGLKCAATSDCPTNMVCTLLALPNMQMGSYCI